MRSLVICLIAAGALAAAPAAAPVVAPAAPVPTFSAEGLARYWDAVAKVQAGAYGPATEVLNGLAGEYPKIPELFATRCSAQLGLGHFAAAEADCAYALRLRPQMASALYALAVAEDDQAKTELAIGHYRQYAALNDPQATFKAQALARATLLAAPPALVVPPPPPPSTGPVAAQPPPPPPPPVAQQGPVGSLFIYRNHLFGGPARSCTLVLDGRVVGDIGHDQFVEVQIASGDHLLEAHFSVSNVFEIPMVLSLPVEVTPGGESYANFDYQMGQLTLQRVPFGRGRKEISDDCRRAFTRKM